MHFISRSRTHILLLFHILSSNPPPDSRNSSLEDNKRLGWKARTHALPSRAGGGGLGRSPLGNPGVARTPCSAFCRQPRCRRRGEEGSWNNKGKLGRAQGGAAPAGRRGEPCAAGSSEAAWPPAGRTGGGEERWGERGGAAA